MVPIKLPSNFRPINSTYRKLHLGVDIPAEFYADIRGIDSTLHFVYHEVETLYEELMNQYTRKLEDPSWNIHCDALGKEMWGYPLTLPDGSYKLENKWHIWQLNLDHGWNHVSNIDSTEPSHLIRIVNRLGKEKLYKAKYGAIGWNHRMRQDDEDREARLQDAKDQQFKDIQAENKWLTRKAMENLERGVTAPSRPQKEIITSYANQGNRTKIVRDITDREGGLVTLDEN